jgi:hypothetical protein
MGEAYLSQSLPRDNFLEWYCGLLEGIRKRKGSLVPSWMRSSRRRERKRGNRRSRTDRGFHQSDQHGRP